MNDIATLFFLMIAGHAVCDFGLQGEWLATNKNRHARSNYPPEKRATMEQIWPHLLFAHAMMHGLSVYLASHSLKLGLLETASHTLIDYGKCERWYGFHVDQFLHIGTKILWVFLFAQGMT